MGCIFAVDTLFIALSMFFLETDRDKDKDRGFHHRLRGQDEHVHLANGRG